MGRRVAESSGEAPELEEEACVGVTGRLWLVGSGWMTCWGGEGQADCAENHGVREQWTCHTMCSRKHSHTHTGAHTHTHTCRQAHSEPQVGRTWRHPPWGRGASLPGLPPGPHLPTSLQVEQIP